MTGASAYPALSDLFEYRVLSEDQLAVEFGASGLIGQLRDSAFTDPTRTPDTWVRSTVLVWGLGAYGESGAPVGSGRCTTTSPTSSTYIPARTLEGSFCVEALDEALSAGRPEIFNSDQGSQCDRMSSKN